ncbi:MAG: RNA-splicing ligase RtcB [Dehalococcoidia bacterium]|nr:RNA-splicing ligase RtcB [Dehalococcoidia bacterium]
MDIPLGAQPGMRVPGRVYANETLRTLLQGDDSVRQLSNMATLPGIRGRALAMPDVHQGYGAPVGGVFATDAATGVVSPGACGYDINCGVRLLRSDLGKDDLRGRLDQLADELFRRLPSGLGKGSGLSEGQGKREQALTHGARWAVREGLGWQADLEYCESGGSLPDANPDDVSRRALDRGLRQIGSLGAGNHFVEIGVVDAVEDNAAASAFGLPLGQVVIWIHTGSRGFGHQICTDYLQTAQVAGAAYGIELPDRQLACMPIQSDAGQSYLSAMACAANFSWANRQVLAHLIRESFAAVFDQAAETMGLHPVYDVAHNIAKFESHHIPGENGQQQTVLVHRKGATRAFPAEHSELPAAYRPVGQPVLVPGDMGRYSYVLVGTPQTMTETFGSLCHGAGRRMSRAAARRAVSGQELVANLRAQGIIVRSSSVRGVAEEAPNAYKDASEVVGTAVGAGLAGTVVRTRPVVVVKG